MQVYRDAQRYDAVYSAARQTLAAGRERLPQGRALLLPTLNLSANAQRARVESDSRDPSVTPSFNRDPRTLGYTVTFAQPIYRPQNYLQYKQSELQVMQAEATFAQAGQDIIVRTAQAYFDVLAALDTLGVVRSQGPPPAARGGGPVSTATITDARGAVRFDLISAQEIAAERPQSKYQALQSSPPSPTRAEGLRRGEARAAEPAHGSWVELSGCRAIRCDRRAAPRSPLWKRDGSADLRPSTPSPPTARPARPPPAPPPPARRCRHDRDHRAAIRIPLYQGACDDSRGAGRGATQVRTPREPGAPRGLHAAELSPRDQRRISAIAALEQTMIPPRARSIRTSSATGGRALSIDVLNARQQLYSTRRDLAVAAPPSSRN